MKPKLDNHIVVFQTNADSDRIVISTLTNHFKRVTVVQTLKDLCRLLVNKTPKVFLITGDSMPNTLTSYYRALAAVSEYKICDHRIVSLIPRQDEGEAYNAFRSGVIDDYLVARPVYEIHRVILICEHLLIQLGVAVNLKSNDVEFVEQITNVTPEVILSMVKGLERKSALRFEFENCIIEIDRALDSATEKIQLNQIVELDIVKLKETLAVIRSNEIRPELLKIQQKAMDLLEHALGTSNKQESESNILQIDSIKPNSENHAFNKLYQQDVNPDSLEDDPDKTPTILVVEDDPISLQLTQKLLNNYKVKLDVAKTGRKAFAALTSQRYDLILLDINLPDTSGIYIVGQISSGYGINSDTPIIMLSGSKDKATVSQAIKNGAKGYIIKPLYKDVINKLFTKYNLPIAAKN
ncbi:MAG: CheY-like chemotaxis protein [Gammaproteobacteria bacterium]|jgi:CheY-like chemotaxis protein